MRLITPIVLYVARHFQYENESFFSLLLERHANCKQKGRLDADTEKHSPFRQAPKVLRVHRSSFVQDGRTYDSAQMGMTDLQSSKSSAVDLFFSRCWCINASYEKLVHTKYSGFTVY